MHGTGRTVRTCTNRANSANRCEHCSVEPALDHHRPFSLESKVRLDHTLLRFRVRVHVRDSIFCDVRVRVHVRGLTICDVRRHECPCPPISGIHSWSARQNEFFKRAWESVITEKCLRKRKIGKCPRPNFKLWSGMSFRLTIRKKILLWCNIISQPALNHSFDDSTRFSQCLITQTFTSNKNFNITFPLKKIS